MRSGGFNSNSFVVFFSLFLTQAILTRNNPNVIMREIWRPWQKGSWNWCGRVLSSSLQLYGAVGVKGLRLSLLSGSCVLFPSLFVIPCVHIKTTPFYPEQLLHRLPKLLRVKSFAQEPNSDNLVSLGFKPTTFGLIVQLLTQLALLF